MPPFGDNSFCLLGIAPAIRIDDAAEAKDDAVFDGRLDASTADKAMRLVGDPRLRLEAELGWPLDAGDLADPGLPERLASQPIDSAPPDAPLARMLLLSHDIATRRLKADSVRVIELAELWQAIQPGTITQLVNDARVKAVIPVAAPDQVADALNRRRTESARDLLASLESPETAGQVLADAVQRWLKNSEPGPFLSDLVQRHNANSEAALQALEEEFDRIDRAVRAIPDKAFSQLPSLQDALQRWDRINQPVQLLEQHRGHEEERSLALGRRLRGLAVYMTNEHDQPLFSDSMVRILLETFPELEGLSATLRNDQQALAPLVALASQALATRREAGQRRAAPVAVRSASKPQPQPRKGGKGWLWALVAAIVGAFMIYGEDSGSLPSSDRNVSGMGTSYSRPVSSPQATPATVRPTAPTLAESTVRQAKMTKPSAGRGRLLSEGEILYCLHQQRVIDTLEPQVRSGQVANFNVLVNDYNSRCSNYQYYDSDMNAAVSSLNSGNISREAQALLASWNSSTPVWTVGRPVAAPSLPTPSLAETMPAIGHGQSLNADVPFVTQAPTASNSSDPLMEALRAAGVSDVPVLPEPADLRDPLVARAAQVRLRDLGFLPADGVDGRFGRGSAAALRNFKASRRLPANDVWDYPTQEELFR